jgi:diguanylate cyclase (GGDEF)-like protein
MASDREAGALPGNDPRSRVVARKARLWPLMLVSVALPMWAAAVPPPLLHTARQVQELSRPEAGRGYPVHLDRAQVTFSRPAVGALFLQDSTGSIFADASSEKPPGVRPGDIVSVDGVTGCGDMKPIILHARFRIVGHAPLPAEPLVSVDRLFSGDYESRWVSIEGIVKSVYRPDRPESYTGRETPGSDELVLTVASGPNELNVITLASGNEKPLALIDAKVRLSGVVGSRFNQRKLLLGVDLYMPDLSYARVLEPASANPLALPVIGVGDIARVWEHESGHRVHVRGVVTSTWGDKYFSVMDSEHGTFVASENPVSVKLGDVLDVAGFPSVGDYTAYLEGAVVRRIGSAPTPPPVHLTVSEAFAGVHDAEPVEIDGQLVDRSRSDNGMILISLTDAGKSFLAVLPPNTPAEALNTLQRGSRVRIKGVCVIHADHGHNPQDLNILPQSTANIATLASPSWWTLQHTLILTALLFAMVLAVIAWNAVLRRRVRFQTRLILSQLEESGKLRMEAEAAHREKCEALSVLQSLQRDLLAAQEKLRHQATHDSLTGLWNRGALLDFLHHEIERTVRTHLPVGILLLDVDHFKIVNDTYGHLVGDAVLKEIADRLTQATRPYDVAGRYGGEEFLVLLPECGREETEHGAERILSAIGSVPFRVGETEFSVTVSIGATTVFDSPDSYTTLLNQADLALYKAKSSGRNCTVMHQADAVRA